MNFDALNGGSASYYGAIVSLEGLTLTLAERCPQSLPDGGWGKPRKLPPTLGGAVSIVSGVGSGQYRRLVSVALDGMSVTLDRAFALDVDSSDKAALGGMRILITPFKGPSHKQSVKWSLHAPARSNAPSAHAQ